MNNSNFKVILSVGNRCYTEIYLKGLGLKKFSSPFGSVYLKNVDNIIHLFKNKINYNNMIHTQDLTDKCIINLNNKHGFRSIYKDFMDPVIENGEHLYHGATFAHHNLKDDSNKKHFDRCFQRIDIIKKHNIKTLFCMFLFPFYGSKYSPHVNVSTEDIYKLRDYLIHKFNCKLLVINFSNKPYKIIENTESLMHVNVYSQSTNFQINKEILQHIFKENNVSPEYLLSYQQIHDL
tara:strand:- start:820 stop:1524 length:705 start_codon:yes stop_codon:yes gene_type:complete